MSWLYQPLLLLIARSVQSDLAHLGHVDLDRASEIIATLWKGDRGVMLKDLSRPEEQLTTSLACLLMHDWIGISKSGDRVWLLSDARQTFGAMARQSPGPPREAPPVQLRRRRVAAPVPGDRRAMGAELFCLR